MAYRNKIYVCFDIELDMISYQTMCSWKQDDGTKFNFFNATDISILRASHSEESIREKIRVRLSETKIFILLVGEKTKFTYKFAKLEIEEALRLGLPIIVVNLNGLKVIDYDKCPQILQDKLVLHISFDSRIMQLAIELWPSQFIDFINIDQLNPKRIPKIVYFDNEL